MTFDDGYFEAMRQVRNWLKTKKLEGIIEDMELELDMTRELEEQEEDCKKVR